MTTTYPNTAAGYAQAIADHGESNLLVDPFADTITVKPAEAAPADRYAPAPTEIDAQTYVNQMPDEQLDWALDQAFGSSPDPDTRRTLFRKFFFSPGVTVDFGDSSVSALQNKITQAEKGGGIVRIAPVAVRS